MYTKETWAVKEQQQTTELHFQGVTFFAEFIANY